MTDYITEELAIKTALEELQRTSGEHFETESWQEYQDITSIWDETEYTMFTEVVVADDPIISKYLEKHPFSEHYFVEARVEDCVVDSLVYVVNKLTKKLEACIIDYDGEFMLDKYPKRDVPEKNRDDVSKLGYILDAMLDTLSNIY